MMSVENQSGSAEFPSRSREVILGPYTDEQDAESDILALLAEMGIDISDCIFSGHANHDLSEKEKIDFEKVHDTSMPDEASDDALLFWFGTKISGEKGTQNPLWYAYKAGFDLDTDPVLDVFSIGALRQVVPASLIDIDKDGEAWLTEEQLEQAKICRFVIKR